MDSMYSLSYNVILFFASDKLQMPSQVIAILQADFYNKNKTKYTVCSVIVIVK